MLAEALLADYHGADPASDLHKRFRLQLLADRHAEAEASLLALRALSKDSPYPAAALHVQYQVLSRADQRVAGGEAFGPAFAEAFREVVGGLDDANAALVIRAMELGYGGMEEALKATLGRLDAQGRLTEADALGLLVQYQQAKAYRWMAPQLATLPLRPAV